MRLEDLVIHDASLKRKSPDKTSLKGKIITVAVTATVMTVMFVVIRVFTDPFTKNIDFTVMGIQFDMNDPTGKYEIKEITVKGTYEYYLFKKNESPRYYGNFSVEGYAYTIDAKTSFDVPTILPGYDHLFYMDSKNHFANMLGTIICTKDFKELFITLYEPIDATSSRASGIVICAPAQTLKEALEIAERQTENLQRSWGN